MLPRTTLRVLMNLLGMAVFLLGCIGALARPAAAYTDPGTGAMLWQALAAGFLGGMFYLRRIIRWFKRPGSQQRQNESQS